MVAALPVVGFDPGCCLGHWDTDTPALPGPDLVVSESPCVLPLCRQRVTVPTVMYAKRFISVGKAGS